MEFKPDNFDQEFNLNKNKNKSKNKKRSKSPRGKIPSWLMILAGVAVIGGVVAARAPIAQTTNTTKSAVVLPTAQPVIVDTTLYTGINDQQADISELEAHFASQGNSSNFQLVQTVLSDGSSQKFEMAMEPLELDQNGYIIPPAEESKDASVYWVDGRPYALTINPGTQEETSGTESTASAYYWLNNEPYEIKIESVENSALPTMPDVEKDKLVYIQDNAYLLNMTPANNVSPNEETAKKAELTAPTQSGSGTELSELPDTKSVPDTDAANSQQEPVVNTPDTNSDSSTSAGTIEKEDNSYDEPIIALLNDKAYVITVKPYSETSQGNEAEEIKESKKEEVQPTATQVPAKAEEPQRTEEPAASSSNAVNIPVTILEEEKKPEKEPLITTFTVDDKTYTLELAEADSDENITKPASQPVVWLDETPLLVSLKTEENPVPAGETGENAEAPIEVSLEPMSAEQTAALQLERFGKDFATTKSEAEAASTAAPEPTSTPIPEPTLTPTNDSWIVNVFNNIFGSNPTATQTPTPQVTVIVFTPTPTTVPPTATPIVVRMVPTAAVQGPIRLDVTPGTKTAVPTTAPKDIAVDPALIEESSEDGPTVSSSENIETENQAADTQYTLPESQRIEVTVLDPETSEDPAAQPTPEELPQTGMAESWNIPSLLMLLAGLLLIIIGVRRLRSKG